MDGRKGVRKKGTWKETRKGEKDTIVDKKKQGRAGGEGRVGKER